MREIVASAPGKIHLLGEHAVVYGKPALLAAVSKQCTVTLTPRKDKKIEIISKNFQKRILFSQKDIHRKTQEAQKAWERFIKTGDVKLLSSITKDELDYAAIAVGETLHYYSSNYSVIASGAKQSQRLPRLFVPRNDILTRGFTLTIDSDIPIGDGLGSSAAVAVAIAAAVRLFVTGKIDKQVIYDIAFRIEQKKHGRPSGGDPATVLYGGLVWFRKEIPDLKIIHPVSFAIPESIAENFYLVDTGKPKESTGEMIASVKKQFDAESVTIGKIFDDQERLTRELLTAIKNSDSTLMIRIIRVGERNLERLGVVSPFVKKLIRDIEKSGGVAKISGGGGIQKGTGMLLAYHKNRKILARCIKPYNLPLQQVKLGVEGLRYE